MVYGTTSDKMINIYKEMWHT